jgi:hypothetical protein
VKRLLLILLAVVAAFAAFVATRPGTFHVERSATMSASAAAIQAHLEDFHAWPGWSPWEKLDPDMKRTHEGSPSGVGAVYAWSGNGDVGEGRMTITGVEPASRVAIRLEMIKPWAATNECAFVLTPDGDATKVTWSMDGKNDFVSKAMGVFMDMDQMIGKDFEQGLANLKTLVEAEAAAAAPADTVVAAP